MKPKTIRSIFLILALAAYHPFTFGQCGGDWMPQSAYPGVVGHVYSSSLWDPDGPGPLPVRVAIGGQFATAGDVTSHHIVAWSPDTGVWQSLAPDGPPLGFAWVERVLGLSDGRLIIAGVGYAFGYKIAEWSGNGWSELNGGTSANYLAGGIGALGELATGELVVGGYMTLNFNGCTVAKWNGQEWVSLRGVQQTAESVGAMTRACDGDLVIGGAAIFGFPGVAFVERWDGASWSSIGPDLSTESSDPNTPSIQAIVQTDTCEFVVGGRFDSVNGQPAQNVVRWDGNQWLPMGTELHQTVKALSVLPGGDLIAGGDFADWNGSIPNGVARWDGAAWVGEGAGCDGPINTLCSLLDGAYLAGGNFFLADSRFARSVARFQNASANPLEAPTSSLSGRISALCALPDGNWAAAGLFEYAGGQPASLTAIWTDEQWQPLGTGIRGGLSAVAAVCVLPNGSLVYGGSFTTAGTVNASNIARWDGAVWRRMQNGTNGTVNALLAAADGTLIVGGFFTTANGVNTGGIARWNGTNWSAIGGVQTCQVYALAEEANGNLIVGGRFAAMGGQPCNNVAQWNGSSWTSLANGLGSSDQTVRALAIRSNGEIVAGGNFYSEGQYRNVAIWNGTAWASLGFGLDQAVEALVCTNDDQVIAGGGFIFSPPTFPKAIARWDGVAWRQMGLGADKYVNALARLSNGDILVGGEFESVNDQGSPFWARWRPATPPTFDQEPLDETVCFGMTAVLSASATGSAPLSYQWQLRDPIVQNQWIDLVDGNAIVGGQTVGTAAGTQSASLSWQDAGFQQMFQQSAAFRCVATNGCSTDVSQSASVSVCQHPGDLNCDGEVNLLDLTTVLSNFGRTDGPNRADGDIDENGMIDLLDLTTLLADFGGVCA